MRSSVWCVNAGVSQTAAAAAAAAVAAAAAATATATATSGSAFFENPVQLLVQQYLSSRDSRTRDTPTPTPLHLA